MVKYEKATYSLMAKHMVAEQPWTIPTAEPQQKEQTCQLSNAITLCCIKPYKHIPYVLPLSIDILVKFLL